jgi:hypothetical protein
MLRGVEGRACGTDHLAVDDDRQSALHFDEIACRDRGDTPVMALSR